MQIFYPETLPIVAHKETIIETLRRHQLLVIAGDTGSGKTTQLPKMGWEAFPENELLIGCTQPRRIAASSVATRVGEELGPLGDRVGYKIRFHDYTTPATKIKFMTDGVLLAETRRDRLLSRYGLLIIDEAHERSLNIDFLLGYIKQLLPRRPDLKVIVTSATIDTGAFARHFGDAPVITIAGRSYPVTVRYNPPQDDDSGDKDSELDHCVQTVCELCKSERQGDILVFLPTERDIRECSLLLEKKISSALVLPLYGRLSTADQRKIFQSFAQRKIVVATNVAETSVTVPGIRYVVDSGLARISQYNVRAKTTSLPITRISRASCDQRKGRCGRIGPGICIRLYSEEDYNDRPAYTLPELQRANLAEVILQMISLDLGRPEKFPFIDPPFKNAIKEGYQLLRELGAIDDTMHLTGRGRIMADLPIDPCISRIIIEAKENNCLREMKIISAVLAIQDPRIRPIDHEKEADDAHKIFTHPHSDFMVLLNIWNGFHDVREKVVSWSRLKKYCKSHFLSFQRMREWIDLHDQLDRILASRDGFTENGSDASYEQIHTALLAGFLRNIATKKQGKIYQGAHNRELLIFPGSHQSMKGGQWLVAASFIETARLYALTVATIEQEWLERVGGHLCRYSWANPHWQKKTGQVVADETVSLFGLIVESGRKVNFGGRSVKNIAEARDIFIQSALVLGEMNGSYPFLTHNLALIERWRETEEKLRERTIIAEDQVFYEFYAGRIPADVYDQKSFNRFLRGKRNQTFLRMKDEDILKRRPDDRELLDYPPVITVGRMQLRLEYHFEPGSAKDGVTFRLPVDSAATFQPGIFEWLVPGLLQEKLTFLLKGLPKGIRKKLVPINETVVRLLDDMEARTGSLYLAIEGSILKHFKILIQRSDWPDNLPSHLQPRFLLFDDAGSEICAGRNLRELLDSGKGDKMVRRVEPTLLQRGLEIVDRWQGTAHTTWDFAGLPATIPAFTQHGEIAGFLYPVLIPHPEKGWVSVAFEKNPQKAKIQNRAGMVYLYRLQFPEQYKNLKKFCTTSFSGPSAVWLLELGMTRRSAVDTLLDFFLNRIFGPLSGSIVAEETFRATVARIKKEGLYALGQKMGEDLLILLRKRRAVHDTIRKIFAPGNKNRLVIPAKEDVFQAHLNDIFPVEMFQGTLPVHFADIDRQLQSLAIRLERFYANPDKDRQKEEQLIPHLANLEELMAKREGLSEEGLEAVFLYREMINDFRIALFSPEIKTRRTISLDKLNQQWRSTQLKCSTPFR